jgi:hypothetical protein
MVRLSYPYYCWVADPSRGVRQVPYIVHGDCQGNHPTDRPPACQPGGATGRAYHDTPCRGVWPEIVGPYGGTAVRCRVCVRGCDRHAVSSVLATCLEYRIRPCLDLDSSLHISCCIYILDFKPRSAPYLPDTDTFTNCIYFRRCSDAQMLSWCSSIRVLM